MSHTLNRLTSLLFNRLLKPRDIPGGTDWHILDVVSCEIAGQLDIWLKNVQTGEKAKYHVTIEKVAQPTSQNKAIAPYKEHLNIPICDCEKAGCFYSGIPGILAHMENGYLAVGAKVERCQRYPTDEAALKKLQELGLTKE